LKQEREGGGAPKGDPRPSEAKRPDQKQTPQQRGEGISGVPPPQGEPAKPPQERGEGSPLDVNRQEQQSPEAQNRKPRTRIVYNPRKETKEEYMKRFLQAYEQKEEKRLTYQREYMRRYRKRLREQHQTTSAQETQEQSAEAIQIFPSSIEAKQS
jgi:hypothetical protein